MYGHRTSTNDDDDEAHKIWGLLYLVFNETQMGMESNKYSPPPEWMVSDFVDLDVNFLSYEQFLWEFH